VVIGAHYDHLGTHGPYLYNGADDNGSGSVAVLAIAHAFVANPKPPKRTVVFALWTGEEDGLLGSRYYTLHPAYPLGKTIAYINMDMISRVRTEDRLRELVRSWGDAVPEETAKKVKADSFMSVSLSQNDDLATVLREADRYVGLTLQLRKSASARGGSDHASFGQAKVPWVSLISTLHDDYHQPGDTIDKVNGAFAEKVAHLVYTTAWLLADR
jgi:Zn-dependent M28 family amino/carboxypeptidase